MVRIRLRRVGKKKQPSFRVVAADKESPRDGRFLEIVGFYNPRTEPATIKLKEDRIYDWMSKGAQMSSGAEAVLRSAGFLERYERFKAGEDVAKLMEEAAAAEAARNTSEKTRREAPKGKPKAKAEAPAEAPAEEAKAAEAPAEEAPAEEAKAEEAPAEEVKAEEAPAEEAKAEEAPAEEVKAEEAPAEEAKAEEAPEETKEEKPAEEEPEITSSRASIDRLELPANISSALSEGGFKTVGKLAKQMEGDQQVLLDISGIGPKALETIEEKLKEFTP